MKYKSLSKHALKLISNSELRMDRSNYNTYIGLPEIHTFDMPIKAIRQELELINAEIARRPRQIEDVFN